MSHETPDPSLAQLAGSIRDDGEIDPLFKSLMKHHWVEEAQHAKLDTLIVDALAEGRDAEQIDRAIDEFFAIGGFLDDGLKAQEQGLMDGGQGQQGHQRGGPALATQSTEAEELDRVFGGLNVGK